MWFPYDRDSDRFHTSPTDLGHVADMSQWAADRSDHIETGFGYVCNQYVEFTGRGGGGSQLNFG